MTDIWIVDLIIYIARIDKLMDCKRLRGGVYFVQELPRTITGKLQRNAAQKLAVSLMENV